ncbi:MAG TPA: Flp pilus assembly protein CpaB [Candidatus Eisenbacteria bacterium]|nr:Flp pilus assembly protein CpaB [Candidatus Eisenbacteria bacterium]
MQNRLKIALVIAVFFGLIAAYGIYNFLRQQKQAAEALRTQTESIVVAAQDIPAGTAINHEVIKKGLVKTVKWPKESLPTGAFTSPEQIVGKTNRVKILANEPILESRLAGEGAGLTARLEPGKRAMAVRVDEIIGVSGFIVPDDRVDVIVTTTPPGNNTNDNKVSKIVLQNKRVLSVAQNVEQREGKPQLARSITLEVTPEEAEKLSLASQDGSIVLALRPTGDDSEPKTLGSNKYDLLSVAAVKRRAVGGGPKPEDKFQVEVIHGSSRKVVEF